MKKNDSTVMSLQLNHIKGPTDTIKLSFGKLPLGLQLAITPSFGAPPFEPVLQLKSNAVIPGIYPVQVLAKDEKGVIQHYDFNVTITASDDCNDDVIGDYTTLSLSSEMLTPVQVTAFGVNEVIISEIPAETIPSKHGGYYGSPVHLLLNCKDNTIVIPEQNVIGHKVSGKGHYDFGAIYLEYTAGAKPFSCTFRRK